MVIFVAVLFSNFASAAPLHDAAENGDIEEIKKLIAGGANIDEERSGNTPMDIAAYLGHKDIVNLLFDKGAKLSSNALIYSAQEGKKDVVEFLIANGLNVSLKNENGNTPLHIAALNGQVDVVKFLVGKEANINEPNKLGITPLYQAVKNGYSIIAELLIINGAQLNTQNAKGSTLLHIATFNDNEEMVKLLISKGVNVNKKNKNDKTPLHTAKEFGYTEIAELLKKNGAKDIPIKKSEIKKFPFSISSDSLLLKVFGLKVLPGRKWAYYYLMGMSGLISELISTPDLSSGSIPNMSINQIGNGKSTGWMRREGKLNEDYVLVSLNISIQNKLNKQLPLKPEDIELKNQDGFYTTDPFAFKFEKQPIYKNFTDGESPIYFPPANNFNIEVLFVLPKKLNNVIMKFPSLKEEYIEINKN